MSGFPVFPREVKGVHAQVDTFAGIWRTHKLGEDVDKNAANKRKSGGSGKDGHNTKGDDAPSAAAPFSFQVGLSLSTRGIDDEYLPDRPTGSDSDEIRYSKYAFGSGLDVLKGRFQLSGGGGADAKGQWTGKVQSGRLLFKWNSPKGDQDNGTGTMKLVSKDEAIVLGFPREDYNAPGEEMGVRLYRMRLGPVSSDDVERGTTASAASLIGGGGGGGNLFPSSITDSLTSFATAAARATTSVIGGGGGGGGGDDDDDEEDDLAEGYYDEDEEGGGGRGRGTRKKRGGGGEKSDGVLAAVTRRVGTRLGSLKAPSWLPGKDQVLGRGKIRDVYEGTAAAAGRGYVNANVHWISLDPKIRRGVVALLALVLFVAAASQAGPVIATVSASPIGESVYDFFNAPHPAYPTTDKLWREGVKRNRKAPEEASPCRDDLIAAQHAVWLHNTCHFQGAGAHRGAMVDLAINEYILGVRRKQDTERYEKKAATNTFWIFDVGGGDVRSTRKIFDTLEKGVANGLLQQHEYRVVAFDPDPNAYRAGVEFQQKHPNFMMQQAVVSDFSGPAKVYMTDRKSPFGDLTAVTDPSSVSPDDRVTKVGRGGAKL